MKSTAKRSILTQRDLYLIANAKFPAAIRSTSIPELQRSAYDQIMLGNKRAMRWAKDNGVSTEFAYQLLVVYLRSELEAEAERRAERRATRFAAVYA